MSLTQSRRRFVGTTAAAGAAALMGNFWPALADDGPPETTTIRILKEPGICIALSTSPRSSCMRRVFLTSDITS